MESRSDSAIRKEPRVTRAKQAIESQNPGVTAELRGQTAVGPAGE
jgi:hypothetical protein